MPKMICVLLALAFLSSACSHRIIVHDCKKVQDDDLRWVCVQKPIP